MSLARVLRRSVSGGPRVVAPSSTAARIFAQGLAARFDARTLALTAGDPVSTWAASAGSLGATATQTGTNRPTYRATGWSNGGPCVQAVKASSQAMDCLALLPLANRAGGHDGSFTVTTHMRRSSLTDMYLFGLDGAIGAAAPYFYVGLDSSHAAPEVGITGGTNVLGNVPETRTDEDSVVVFSYDGTSGTMTMWVNGQRKVSTVGTPANVYATAMILGLHYGGFAVHPSSTDALVRDQVIHGRDIGVAGVAATMLTLGRVDLWRWTFVHLGDSIALGLHPSITPAGGVATSLLANVSDALGGRTLGPLAANPDPTNTVAYHLSTDMAGGVTYTPRVVLIDAASNQAYYGDYSGGTAAVAAEMAAAQKANVDAWRAAWPNDYIVVSTMLPRAGVAGGGFPADPVGLEAARVAYNATVLAGAVGADAVWDKASIVGMNDPLDATKYGDRIHPTAAGYALLAADINPLIPGWRDAAVRRLLARMMVS